MNDVATAAATARRKTRACSFWTSVARALRAYVIYARVQKTFA